MEEKKAQDAADASPKKKKRLPHNRRHSSKLSNRMAMFDQREPDAVRDARHATPQPAAARWRCKICGKRNRGGSTCVSCGRSAAATTPAKSKVKQHPTGRDKNYNTTDNGTAKQSDGDGEYKEAKERAAKERNKRAEQEESGASLAPSWRQRQHAQQAASVTPFWSEVEPRVDVPGDVGAQDQPREQEAAVHVSAESASLKRPTSRRASHRRKSRQP